MNLPFQFWSGSHISMLIRESDVGFSVSRTRQCAGMFAGGGRGRAGGGGAAPRAGPAAAVPGPAPRGGAPRAGGGPSGTTAALVIVASVSFRLATLSQGVAVVLPTAARRSNAVPIMVGLRR